MQTELATQGLSASVGSDWSYSSFNSLMKTYMSCFIFEQGSAKRNTGFFKMSVNYFSEVVLFF